MGNHRRIGRCKLCLKAGVSVNRTHVLPPWAHDTKKRMAHLLCTKCLAPIKQCETYVHNTLATPKIDSNRLDLPQMAFFAASVAWRAHTSKWESFSLNSYEEGFRLYLLGGPPPSKSSITLDFVPTQETRIKHTESHIELIIKTLRFEITMHPEPKGKTMWHHIMEIEPNHRCLWWGLPTITQ